MKKSRVASNSICLSAICACAMMAALCLLFGMTPFGNNTFLTGDLNSIYINFYAQMRAAFLQGENLFYSFQKGLGGSTIGSLAYYCASPFVLLYMLVPVQSYGVLTTFVVWCKVVLLCVSMAFFLRYKLKTDSLFIVAISLCYGFCTWVFVYLQNIMWHDVLILLPLLCYGVDVLIERRKPLCFVLCLAMSIIVNFYIAFMVCLFIVAYFLYSLVLLEKEPIKSYLYHCVRFAAASILGGMLSAILWLPAMVEILQSKGTLNNAFSLSFATEFSLVSFAARLLPFGFYWNNLIYDLPNVYVGILPLLLVAAFFAAKHISRKEKCAAFAVLLFLFVSMWSTDVMLLFHGGTMPVWFSFRNAFLFVFWLCVLAAKASAENTFSKRVWVAIGGVVVVLLACRICFVEVHYTVMRLLVTLVLCAGLLFFLFLCKQGVFKDVAVFKQHAQLFKRFCAIGLLGVVMLELLLNLYYIQGAFEQYPNDVYIDFVAQNTALIQEIDEQEEQTAYRIEKDYFRSLNDALLLDYYGIGYFSSTQDDLPVDYLINLGVFDQITGLYDAASSDVFADSLLGIQYLLIRDAENVQEGYIATGISNEQAEVYQNPYALPMAFCVDEEILQTELDSESAQAFKEGIYQALAGEDALALYDETAQVNLEAMQELSSAIWENAADVTMTQTTVSVSVSTQAEELLFINVPYSAYLQVTVNGVAVEKYIAFESQLAVYVPAGDSVVVVTYQAPLFLYGVGISALALCALVLWVYKRRKEARLRSE